MCFGPSSAEKQAAADARVEADTQKRQEIEKVAEKKRADITEAIDTTAERQGRRGMRAGQGRRSLFRSASAGFLGRFD